MIRSLWGWSSAWGLLLESLLLLTQRRDILLMRPADWEGAGSACEERASAQMDWILLTVSKGQTSHEPIILPKPAIQGLFIWVLHCALPAWLRPTAPSLGLGCVRHWSILCKRVFWGEVPAFSRLPAQQGRSHFVNVHVPCRRLR